MSTCRDTSLRTHQPEPPALRHTHSHSELTVSHVQDALALAHHHGAATIAVWAEAGIGVACRGKKRQVSPQHTDSPGPTASSGSRHSCSHYTRQPWPPTKAH